MSQFFYSRMEPVKDDKGQIITNEAGEQQVIIRKDSFALNKVIRTVEIDDNRLVVLLDDMHTRVKQVPNFSPKTGKPTGTYKSVEESFQSELYITVKEEVEAYRKIAIK